MILEISEAHHLLLKIINTTPYTEKLLIIAHSSSHILLAILYAILLIPLIVLDIVVVKEMFKE
jgi:hypothetical protein